LKNVSLMGVQKFATARNAEVEIFIGFVLEHYCQSLVSEQRINEYEITAQKHYESEIASDVWDHYVVFFDLQLNRTVRLWCQTTCYKGNASGRPEPNKTYEIRETLVEAISLKAEVDETDDLRRTVHFTVGPKQYTYGWFAAVKEKSFDLSLYLDAGQEDVFILIGEAFAGAKVEFQIRKRLQAEVEKGSGLGKVVNHTVGQLWEWHVNQGLREQELAHKQGELVAAELKNRREEIEACIDSSGAKGLDIKKKCNDLIHGSAETEDELLMLTVQQLLARNPFVKRAIQVLDNWGGFQQYITGVAESADSVSDFVTALWSEPSELRLLNRRLLLRTQATESIHYIQDLNVDGVTEHNLYGGDHTVAQLQALALKVVQRLATHGIDTAAKLAVALTSANTKALLRSSIWFEGRNGTDLKPSFDYITNSILVKKEYLVISGDNLKPKPIGYHASLATEDTVKAYTNLSAISTRQGEVVAILKGKYFRQQEFARRCKEEAYVALTLKHKLDNSSFSVGRNIPLIMFVDMPENYAPPAYALRRLMAFGWSVAFSYEDVVAIIKSGYDAKKPGQ
jgi:hypothetical protein